MFKLLIIFVFLIPSLFAINKREQVVCLHGFMGAPWNMHFIEKRLKRDQWNAVTWQYSSRDCFIEEHAEKFVFYLIELASHNHNQPIHFVAHSMGGLVLLAALNHPLCPQEAKIGKVVLLAPPARGTHFGRWMGQFSLAKWIAKDFSGQELMTKTQFDYLGKYPSSLEGVLVIAGSLGFNPLLEKRNDGTLAVSETCLSTPHKHVVIKRGHKTIIFGKRIYHLISQFLESND